MELPDLFPQGGMPQRNYCDTCGGHLELAYALFDESISGVRIKIQGLPYLVCPSCGRKHLPDRSRIVLISAHEQASAKKLAEFASNRKKIVREFGITKVAFLYDPDDYYYIPGLLRDIDDGFLTPLFFNKEVLIKYDAHPSYRVSYASSTYGEIHVSDEGGIPFWINRHGKVVMWLWDVLSLPESEQHYLRSENVPSDHSIGSEFYDGQIECIFTEATPENRLFEQRSRFLEACYTKLGKKIAHLDLEVLELATSLCRPVIDTPKERRNVADALNKIYLESLDNKALESLLVERGIDPEGLGGLKRLQLLLEHENEGKSIIELMDALNALYYFRVACSHLGSRKGHDKEMGKVCARLNIPAGSDLFVLYDALISGLSSAFEELSLLLE